MAPALPLNQTRDDIGVGNNVVCAQRRVNVHDRFLLSLGPTHHVIDFLPHCVPPENSNDMGPISA